MPSLAGTVLAARWIRARNNGAGAADRQTTAHAFTALGPLKSEPAQRFQRSFSHSPEQQQPPRPILVPYVHTESVLHTYM